MNVNILNPEHQRFIDEQVQSGRFESSAEVVAEALAEFISNDLDEEDFNDETAARINEAYERGERGEPGLTVEEVRQKLLGPRSARKTG